MTELADAQQVPAASGLPPHISIWGELADTDHRLLHVDAGGVRTRVLQAGAGDGLRHDRARLV